MEENKKLIIKILTELPYIQEILKLKYTYHSNKIENNSLSYGDVVTVLKDGFGVCKPIKDIIGVINHEKALNYVLELSELKETISLRNIREIQSLIEPTKSGFRKNLVDISNTNIKTAEPFEIPLKLENIIKGYNESEDDLFTKLAKFHMKFEKIHPFEDGNGRTGRLLMNLELLKKGYPLTAIKFENRPEYYNAFKDANAMADLIKRSVTDTMELVKETAK